MLPLDTTGPPADGSRAPLLRDRVHRELRADMIACRLPPGTEMRESELAARFHLSKSPVRDALMRLEREGLVITLPRQGYRVAPVSVADVDDMFHLREALERACMERIVRTATNAQLGLLDRFRTFDLAEWPGGFVAYNREFHLSLARVAGNVRMCMQVSELIDQMERAVQLSLSALKRSDPQSLVDEHSAIIDALQARKTSLAQRLSGRHVTAAGKRALHALACVVVAR